MPQLRKIASGVLVPVSAAALWIAYSAYQTEADIAAHARTVETAAAATPSRRFSQHDLARLPDPVQAYFRYVFVAEPRPATHVSLAMAGEFRRPGTEGFAPTTATQTIAVGTPALMFAATTPIVTGIWARAYDAFADGKMEMKAKILSTLTVVDERETDALNRTSLRRWLLESPLYPMSLLPGGPVRWEAIDERHARAIVSHRGLSASLVATFRDDGSLERFDAEADGDLSTPYHGSGEHVTRSDYRLIDGTMIPLRFTIARAAGGRTYPFWRGQVTEIAFHYSDSN